MSENNESGGKTRAFCVCFGSGPECLSFDSDLERGWDAEWNACCNNGKMEGRNY
jgi:hypothetical protein